MPMRGKASFPGRLRRPPSVGFADISPARGENVALHFSFGNTPQAAIWLQPLRQPPLSPLAGEMSQSGRGGAAQPSEEGCLH